MDSAPEQGAAKSGFRRKLLLIGTNVFSIACLWWVLHNMDWHDFGEELRHINWGWLAIAVGCDVSVYVWHGWRWSLLLTPIERIPVLRSVRAIYVGLFANEVLPLRTGEVIRCYLQARWSSIPFSVSLSSALIERIFDGFYLVVCLFVTVKLVPGLPQYVVDGSVLLALLIVAAAAVVAIAMFYKQQAHAALSERGWHRHLRILIEDLHVIGHSRYLYFAALATIPYLLTQILPIYAVMRAYPAFAIPAWRVAIVLMIVLRLGSAVPQAPGNVGAFQALTVVVLNRVFGYDAAFSKGFSLFLWAAVTLPLLIVGFIALTITGAKIGELSHKAHSAMPTVKVPQ
jgi:glycosyltransferase 2 family protein